MRTTTTRTTAKRKPGRPKLKAGAKTKTAAKKKSGAKLALKRAVVKRKAKSNMI